MAMLARCLMATSLTAGVHDRYCFHGVAHHLLLAAADNQLPRHLRPACMLALGTPACWSRSPH